MINNYRIGCDFNTELLELINRINMNSERGKIAEVFGSIALHSRFRARPSYRLPKIDEGYLRQYICELRNIGVDLNYTLNFSTLGNYKDTCNMYNEIVTIIKRLANLGVNKFTVTLPLVAQAIREVSKDIQIVVSTIAEVCSISQIIAWNEQFNVAGVCLDIAATRDISLVFAIASYAKKHNISISLIVNELCGTGISCGASKCINRRHCYDLHSLDYTPDDLERFDGYPFKSCISSRDLASTWLKLPFIRPEDIKLYNGIGVNTFKITGRVTNSFGKIVQAYCNEYYDGNSFDLCRPAYTILSDGKIIKDNLPTIDNRLLDGFLSFWFDHPYHRCTNQICGQTCNYCDSFYEKISSANGKDTN